MIDKVLIKLKPIKTIELDLGIDANGKKQLDLTNRIYRHMFKYVPFSGASTGPTPKIHLREKVDIATTSITFKSSYAKRQYYGSQTGTPWHYTTKGTGPFWDKKMLTAEKDEIVREMNRKYGGR